MKLLGIDHGLKRIGLAVSDPSGLIARELAIINRTSNAEDLERIRGILDEQRPAAMVIGLPINENTPANAETVRRWAARLATITPLPVTFWDENLTSVDARELSIRQKRKPRDPIDDLAARVMLQSYLDALRDGLATPPEPLSKEN
jgi:putative Holliday junction resolvase